MTDRPLFDLVDEPWLPCLDLDGQFVQLGLRQTLLRAHELRELFDPSPLVTVSLHRLLLAVLHRALDGPRNFEEWPELWQAAHWDPGAVGDYLDQWRRCFDLFDTERPFYGVPAMDGVRTLPVTLLAIEAASGNNATLFDHNLNDRPAAISPAEAARWIVARQAFSFGGGVSRPFNLTDSPLIRDFSVLAFGETLFETLALNLLPYGEQRPIPWLEDDDLPAWEQETPRAPDQAGTPPLGYVDYLTWQSRRIHLIPEVDTESGAVVVRLCQLQQNLKLALSGRDPFKAYVTDKEGGERARKLDPDKAVWRDSHALFQQAENRKRPDLFNFLARVDNARGYGKVDARPVYALGVFGLATVPGRASVELWRQERLPLPLAYLDDEALTAALGDALRIAENVAKALRGAIWRFAELLLSPMADSEDGRKPLKDDVAKLRDHLGADLPYWARLETVFVRLLQALPRDAAHDEAGRPVFAGDVRDRWADELRRIARDAFEGVLTGLEVSARTLKASVRARGLFEYELGKSLNPLAE